MVLFDKNTKDRRPNRETELQINQILGVKTRLPSDKILQHKFKDKSSAWSVFFFVVVAVVVFAVLYVTCPRLILILRQRNLSKLRFLCLNIKIFLPHAL